MVVLVKNEFYTDGNYSTPQIHAYESVQMARDDMLHDIRRERQALSDDDNVEILIDVGLTGERSDKLPGNFWEIRAHNKKIDCDCILLWDLDEVVCEKEMNVHNGKE